MSLFPCSACKERKPGKFANVTWAWWTADQQRTAWRQRLCLDCYVATIVPLQVTIDAEPLSCPACHSDPGDDMDPTYVTAYVPGVGPERLEMATCAPCAVGVRIRAQEGAEKLPDRLLESRGQDPGPSTMDPVEQWRALGHRPWQE